MVKLLLRSGIFCTLIVVVVAVVLSAGCVTPPTEEKTVYTVGVNGNYPPYSYYDISGGLTGFDVDVMKEIAEDQNIQIKFKEVPWTDTISSLVSHDIDIFTSHLVITQDRENLVDFSKPYGTVGEAIAVKNKSNFTYEQFASGDMRIGVQSDTINSRWVESVLGKELYDTMVTEGWILLYTTFPQSMIAVELGLVDCAVFDEGDVVHYIRQAESQPGEELKILAVVDTNDSYGIAVRQNDTKLLEHINTGLDHVMSSEKWHELLAKYQVDVL